jgi:hypothetical protein
MDELKAPRRVLAGKRGLLAGLAVGAWLGSTLLGLPARAEGSEPKIKPGMQCTVADGWWSLDRQRPVQPEPVRVLKLQTMVSAEPGAWVKPLRGPMTDYQYLIAIERLSDCKE